MPDSPISQSPTPIKFTVSEAANDNQFSFPIAIQAIIDGKRITKLEWGTPEIYGELHKGRLMFCDHGQWHQWIVNDGDLYGTDWAVLTE